LPSPFRSRNTIVAYDEGTFHPVASLQAGPANGASNPVPVESAQVSPAAARPQTSALPSPSTSENWIVEAYAAAAHPAASLQAGPRTSAPKLVPVEVAQ
jgi:hypothetical protein